jgi:imidazolonepropionase-like amidohydrolase
VILVEDGEFVALGDNVAIPAGAAVVDRSELTVLSGLVDAHDDRGDGGEETHRWCRD